MSREIKFRCWDKIIKQMFIPTMINADGDVRHNGTYKTDCIGGKAGRILKSGKYRVVKFFDFGLFRNEGYWNLSDFPFELYPKHGIISEVEVIGNIYENPELKP